MSDSVQPSKEKSSVRMSLSVVVDSFPWVAIPFMILNGSFVVLDIYLFTVGGHNGISTLAQIPLLDRVFHLTTPLILGSWVAGIGWVYSNLSDHQTVRDESVRADSQTVVARVVVGLLGWSVLVAAILLLVFILP